MIEEEWPVLPGLLANALNSSNAIAKEATELEWAASLATWNLGGMTLGQAVARAKQATTTKASTMDDISHYVQHFGGQDHKLIFFLVQFSTFFANQLMIGQEMMHHLAMVNFRQPGCMFPFLRCAIWATLASSPHVKDGYSKILTKSDVEKLRSSTLAPKIATAETQLQTAWQGLSQPISDHEAKCFGRFCIRTILWLVQKERLSRETISFQSQVKIQEAFTNEIQEGPVKPVQAEAQDLQVADTTQASPKALALLQNPHIKVNAKYLVFILVVSFFCWVSNVLMTTLWPDCRYVNQKDHPGQVFQLQAMDDSKATFLHPGLWGEPTTVAVPLDKLVQWKATKQELAILCKDAKPFLYQDNEEAKVQLAKVEVEMAMHHGMAANTVAQDQVAFSLHPPGLFSLKAVKRIKGLTLVAIGNITKQKVLPGQSNSKSIHKISHKGVDWTISNWKQDSVLDPAKPGHLDPYWWVKPTEEESEANMGFGTITVDGIAIPVLQNTKHLQEKDQLLYLKPKAAKEASHEEDVQESKPPAKRAKKNK